MLDLGSRESVSSLLQITVAETAHLICAFVFAYIYENNGFSNGAANIHLASVSM